MRRLVALVAFALLAGCSHTSELKELERQANALNDQVIADNAVANHLLDLRKHRDQVKEQVVRAGLAQPVDQRAADLLAYARDALGSTSVVESHVDADGTRRMTLTAAALPDGMIANAIDAITHLSPSATLGKISRTSTGLTVTLAVSPPPTCALPTPTRLAPPKLPPQELLSSPQRRQRLLARISQDENLLGTLTRIVDETRQLTASNDCDEKLLASLRQPDHLATALPIVDATFGAASLVTDATIDLDATRLHVVASPKDGHSLDDVRHVYEKFGQVIAEQQTASTVTIDLARSR